MALFKKKLKYSTIRTSKKDIPEGLWIKCKACNEMLYKSALKQNMNICPSCNYHAPLSASERITLLTDKLSFKEIDVDLSSVDTLNFTGTNIYTSKIKANQKKTGMKDAIICGTALLDKIYYALGVMDFRFLGASMGSVVGEKVCRVTELATEKKIPLVIVTASGGARMYEGMLSLMQMAKTSAALARHTEANLPYIVIMTHPTTAGVSASFASLGDVILAEPNALIGFAGPRVIKQTTQSELPKGFQKSEFLLKHGFIDKIIDRKELKTQLSLFLQYFTAKKTSIVQK